MAEYAQEALDELLEALRATDAPGLADDITTVISRGETREVEAKGRAKELTQAPLLPDEAYAVSIEMVIALLEPMLMRNSIVDEFSKQNDEEISIKWERDFIEESPITPEAGYARVMPQFDENEMGEFETDLRALVKLFEEK